MKLTLSNEKSKSLKWCLPGKQCISEAIKCPSVTPTAPLTTIPIVIAATYNKPKLPKLTLPWFRGDLTTWTTFWDLFKSTVHENNEVQKVDKFSYLKSVLEGAAARVIQRLTQTMIQLLAFCKNGLVNPKPSSPLTWKSCWRYLIVQVTAHTPYDQSMIKSLFRFEAWNP